MGDPKSLKKGNREFIQHCDDSKKLTCVYKSFDERAILEIDGRCIENRRLGRIYQNIYYKINCLVLNIIINNFIYFCLILQKSVKTAQSLKSVTEGF